MPANTALTICRIQCDTTSRGANANANAVDLNAQPNSSPLQVAIARSSTESNAGPSGCE